MRLISRRSSISCACTRALRSIASSPRPRSTALAPILRTCDQPRMELSGVLSSCESVARNSSFIALARCASARAELSFSSSRLRSSSACLRGVASRQTPDMHSGRPRASSKTFPRASIHAMFPSGLMMRYSVRYSDRFSMLCWIAANTFGLSSRCRWRLKSSKLPANPPGGRPWIDSSVGDQRIFPLATCHSQSPICPASSAICRRVWVSRKVSSAVLRSVMSCTTPIMPATEPSAA